MGRKLGRSLHVEPATAGITGRTAPNDFRWHLRNATVRTCTLLTFATLAVAILPSITSAETPQNKPDDCPTVPPSGYYVERVPSASLHESPVRPV